MALKAQNIYCLAPHGKSLPAPGVGDQMVVTQGPQTRFQVLASRWPQRRDLRGLILLTGRVGLPTEPPVTDIVRLVPGTVRTQ